MKLKKKKEYFDPRSYYPWKLVLANARSGKRRGSRAEPTTTHPHSSIKHKCHLPMPDPHELRLLPRLLAPRRRVSFPIPRLPLLLYFSIGSISVPWRSISPRGDSRKKRNHGRTQPPADPSSVTRAIFTHARTGGTKRSNRGTVPWLTFEPFTFSRTLIYIYIYTYIFPREKVEYFRSWILCYDNFVYREI